MHGCPCGYPSNPKREGGRISNGNRILHCDGERAISLLGQFQPDLVILDLNITRIGGFEILERNRPMERALVVVITSSDRADERARALALGVREYIVKPMNWAGYVGAVQGAMERWLPKRSEGTSRSFPYW